MDMSGVDTEQDIAEQERWERRRRRFGLAAFLWLVLAGLVLGVVFLPRIASLPPVRDRIVARINASLAPAALSVDDWTLRWRGGQRAEGIRFVDPARGVAVAVAGADVSAGLLKLIPYRSVDAGVVTLREPLVRLARAVPAAGASAEASAEESPAQPTKLTASTPAAGGTVAAPPAATAVAGPRSALLRIPVRAETVVRDGRIVVAGGDGDTVLADRVAGTLTLEAWDKPVALKGECRVPFGDGGGTVRVDGELPEPRLLLARAFDDPACKGRLALAVTALDLRVLRPLLATLTGAEWVRQGVLDLTAEATLAGLQQATIETELAVADFSFAAPGLQPSPEGDVALTLAARRDARGVAIRSCALRSPWGAVSAGGRLEATATTAVPIGKIAVTGTVDVAAAVRDFKPFLGLDEMVRAERGTIRFAGAVAGTAQARTMQWDASAEDLRLFYGDEPVRLMPPPRAALSVRLPYTEPPELTALDVVLPFARVSGSGRLDRGSVSGKVDLTALSRDYRRIIRACPPMVGQILFQLTAARNGAFSEVSATAGIADLAVEVRPGKRAVVQQADTHLAFRIPLQGGMPQPEADDVRWVCAFEGGSVSGAVARVTLPRGGQPVAAEGVRAALDLDVRAVLQAFRTLLPLPAGATAEGRLLLNLTAEVAGGAAEGKFTAAGRGLALQTTAWSAREPDARAEGALSFDDAGGTAGLANLSFTARAARIAVPRLRVRGLRGGGPLAVDGAADVSADLGEVSRWRRPSRDGAAPPQIDGSLRLRLDAAAAPGGTRLALDGALDGLSFAPARGRGRLREKRVALKGAAVLAADARTLELDALGIATEWLDLAAKGEIADLTGAAAAALRGTVAVDYGVLAQRLAASGMNHVALSGKPGPRPFTFKGDLGGGLAPLRSFAAAEGTLGVGGIRLLEMDVAPADAALALREGVLTLSYQPAAGAGAVRLRPVVQVAVDPPVLEIGGGAPILDRVPLTQAFTDTLLAMVNPLLRGCLVGGGTVDLTAAETLIPLAAVAAEQVETTLAVTLHDCPFTVAGVLAEAFDLAGIERREIVVKQTTIRAVCRDGRIQTEPFEMAVNDHKVRFHGSVGFDQSVAYVVELPLTEKLVGREAWPFLKGLTLRLPVTGTLTNLKLDKEAGRKEVSRILREAAARALGAAAAERLNELLRK